MGAFLPRFTFRPAKAVRSGTACLRAAFCAAATLAALALAAPDARAETRSLSLYNTHTGEKAVIAFKRDGRFLPDGLQELNRFLRDWRRNEATKMDPNLFDLVWDVYQQSGASKPIHVVSGYRSPATNNMLRSRSRGVAKTSQHMRGKAMDFFIPDANLAKLRAIGLRKQIGGVGFYPTSGSPFVHMDTGSVRHWPRMTRAQLARVFPDGKTIHVPTDGKPMPGYKQAKAELDRRKSGKAPIVVASATPRRPLRGGDNDSIRPVPATRSNTGTGFIASLFSDNDTKREAPSGPTPPGAVGNGTTRAPGAIAQTLPGVKGAEESPQLVADVTPRFKPEIAPAAAPEPASEPAPADVPILVAALPHAKPARLAPPIVAALPTPAPEGRRTDDASDAIAALTAEVPKPKRTSTSAAADNLLAYASPNAEPATDALPPVLAGTAARAGAARTASLTDPASTGAGDYFQPQRISRQIEAAPSRPQTRPATSPRTAAKPDQPVSLTGTFPREHDPFARFASLPDKDEPRFLLGSSTTRTKAFADLRHPDQRRLGELMGRPARILLARFDQANPYGALRTDQFNGPAIVSLPVVSAR